MMTVRTGSSSRQRPQTLHETLLRGGYYESLAVPSDMVYITFAIHSHEYVL